MPSQSRVLSLILLSPGTFEAGGKDEEGRRMTRSSQPWTWAPLERSSGGRWGAREEGGRQAAGRGELVQAAGRAAFSNWRLDCWVPEPEEPSGHHSIWKRDRRR